MALIWAVTNQAPRNTISYCLENNGFYCSLNPIWRWLVFSQSGDDLKIEDGGDPESAAMLENSPPASTEDLGSVSRISMATQSLKNR